MGARSVFLTQYVCFKSINMKKHECIKHKHKHKHKKINIFRSTRCAWHTNTISFRLSADLVVSSFAINQLMVQ